MRARCTNDVRSVSRLENEAVLDRMAERLKKRPEILDRRREVVEHPFGSIKRWTYQGALLFSRGRRSTPKFSGHSAIENWGIDQVDAFNQNCSKTA